MSLWSTKARKYFSQKKVIKIDRKFLKIQSTFSPIAFFSLSVCLFVLFLSIFSECKRQFFLLVFHSPVHFTANNVSVDLIILFCCLVTIIWIFVGIFQDYLFKKKVGTREKIQEYNNDDDNIKEPSLTSLSTTLIVPKTIKSF